MSLTIETDLKDIFAKIDQRLERMEQGQNELKLSVSELKGEVKTLSSDLKGEIKALDIKVVGTNEKIDVLQKTVTNLSTDVSTMKQDISDLKGVKSLIVPAVVAIIVSLLSLLVRGINIS
jgi:chromosome segregation ATPase